MHAKIGGVWAPEKTICSNSYWAKGFTSSKTKTVYSDWVKLERGAKTTGTGIRVDFRDTNPNFDGGQITDKSITIPAY